MITERQERNFWAKVEKGDGCWEWRGSRFPNGYGQFCIGKNPMLFRYAHQVALVISGRDRPAGAIALHSCDNRGCVNPAHLRWGTHRENTQDMLAKGRADHHGWVAGTRNGNAKITDEQARQIRAAKGLQRDIADAYGVSRQLVSAIKTGDAWRHLW